MLFIKKKTIFEIEFSVVANMDQLSSILAKDQSLVNSFA